MPMAGNRARRRALGILIGLAVAVPSAAFAQTPDPAPVEPTPVEPTPVAPTPVAPAPVAPAPVAPVAAPARFPMPMDTGPKMTAQAAKARLDILALQPKLTTATSARDEAQQQWETLGAELVQLEDLRTRTAGDVSAAKERLGRSAARAYRQSGGVELNAALEAVRGAEDLLDLSRDVH